MNELEQLEFKFGKNYWNLETRRKSQKIKISKIEILKFFFQVLEGQNILVTISGKKNRVRVYYLSWLKSKILRTDNAIERRAGWINVGDLQVCKDISEMKCTNWLWQYFTTISCHFFANYINIFHKTEVLMNILRCQTCLNLNWIKNYVSVFFNFVRKKMKICDS